MIPFTRRQLMLAAGAMALGACSPRKTAEQGPPLPDPALYRTSYGPIADDPFLVPPADLERIDPRFRRQVVDFRSREPPGTIIVDTDTFHLYLTLSRGKAIRYGVGLGRQGFAWSGTATIEDKQKWPKWFPPEEMIERQPELGKYSEENGGQQPGLRNPLGARALYLYENGKDTLYRLHGTAEEASIGNAVSSGCVRLLNHDIIDLYERVPLGTRVVVIGPAQFSGTIR